MTAWVIAGFLGMAAGLRIGWVLVNKQSAASTGMIVALGSLTVMATLNWEPLTTLVNTATGWPNVSVALSQVALTACAAGSCVMITSMSADRTASDNNRWARRQYLVAAVIAIASLVTFFASGRRGAASPRDYLQQNARASGTAFAPGWLIPVLYVAATLSVVLWAGMSYSNRTRRGRALFLFTIGSGLLVLAALIFVGSALMETADMRVGTAVTLVACAMAVVALGSLLPTLESWVVARREMYVLAPLYKDLKTLHPDAGIGVRPRGPLAFRVADRMAYISDALFLEAMQAQGLDLGTARVTGSAGEMSADTPLDPGRHERAGRSTPDVIPAKQARAVADWVHRGRDGDAAFPGPEWLHQPEGVSDREWILEIASQYRRLAGAERASRV